MTLRALILKNRQSPGDVLVLSAAVRDLHRIHPGRFSTKVETSADAIWDQNPYVLREASAEAEVIECHYPLIHKSNSGAWHFIHAFHHFLSDRLGVRLEPQEFKGDIYLSERERTWISQVQELTRVPVPFWIIVAGGKNDFTAKWFEPTRLQDVVDHFRGKILFVQVGEQGHHHPPLRGVLDLRGKTTLRQYIRLMHHAQGAICPVTFTMHLAAATPVRERCGAYSRGMPQNRPCVVIAGGREPVQWEAYPHHQFIHTVGALPCCAHGGCWKSRVLPMDDGSDKDRSLCLDAVDLESGIRKPGQLWAQSGARQAGFQFEPNDSSNKLSDKWTLRFLPQCLNLISADEIIRRVEIYFAGGVVEYLTAAQASASDSALSELGWSLKQQISTPC